MWRRAMLLGLGGLLWVAGCEAATDEEICGERAGMVLCGYCRDDRIATGNEHGGTCRFCPEGNQCLGDVCGELRCGACETCACPQFSTCSSCGGGTCESALCGAPWCCPGECDLSNCGCL